MQFTPDLLPTDITGVTSSTSGRRVRLPARARSSRTWCSPTRSTGLAEDAVGAARGMQERQVTVDGVHTLAAPFFVVATQNPIEHEGTFPLPEAQLDRFTLRLALGYPGRARKPACWRTRPPPRARRSRRWSRRGCGRDVGRRACLPQRPRRAALRATSWRSAGHARRTRASRSARARARVCPGPARRGPRAARRGATT